MFERGTSGKMENLGLSWSLDYKEHIVLTTQACWALPPLVPEEGRLPPGGYPELSYTLCWALTV